MFEYKFGDAYRMTDIVFSLGYTTIEGLFSGSSRDQGSVLEVSGRLYFVLRDAFTDPLDIREQIERLNLGDLTDYQGNLWRAKPYDIVDEWFGTLSGLVM